MLYDNEKFIGKVLAKDKASVGVQCLEKPFGTTNTPQDFERDTEFYSTVYATCVKPTLVQLFPRGWKWAY